MANAGTVEGFNPAAGLQRSAQERMRIWFHQNRFRVFGALSLVVQVLIVRFAVYEGQIFDQAQADFEDVSFVSDLRIAPTKAPTKTAEGELKATNDLKKKKEVDPRIANAKNPYLVGARLPIDMTSHIKPPYTSAARAAGVEGMLVLQVVIADSGQVLRVRVVGRRLGHGLERAAIRAFYRKRFKPARVAGKPITVKLNFPVRFTLG